jgi:hypothetical protein
MRSRLPRLTLAILAACAGISTAPVARAEHAATLFAGPELRARASDAEGHPGYELSLPHGIATEGGRTAFVGRLGLLLPWPRDALVLPVTMGVRKIPFGRAVAPLLGVDLGGYLVRAAGARPADSPGGPQLCWSMRALAGLALALGRSAAFVAYVDATWVQPPRDQRAQALIGSSLGAGVELRVAFTPHFRLTDMILQGTDAPEGF